MTANPVRPHSGSFGPREITAPPATPASAETGIDNFLRLMRQELAEPLKRVAELADRVEELRASGYLPSTLSGERTFVELADTARRTAGMAWRVLQLGEVLTGPSILADDRILLADALRRAAVETNELARRRQVGVQLDDGEQSLAPVYGSTAWLDLALKQLVSMLVEAAPGSTHVLVRLKQVGFHQLIVGSVNHGRQHPGAISLLPPKNASVKSELARGAQIPAIDLAMARAIVELHGGALKTDQSEGGRLSEFHLTLPTGESQSQRERPSCGNCPHMRQAEQFAQDIGELLNAMQHHLDTRSDS